MMPSYTCTDCTKAPGCVFAREGFWCKSITVTHDIDTGTDGKLCVAAAECAKQEEC